MCDDENEIILNENSKLSDLAPHLGTEIDRESDDTEINLSYETDKAYFELDCSLSEVIMRIFIEEKSE